MPVLIERHHVVDPDDPLLGRRGDADFNLFAADPDPFEGDLNIESDEEGVTNFQLDHS